MYYLCYIIVIKLFVSGGALTAGFLLKYQLTQKIELSHKYYTPKPVEYSSSP